MTLVGIPRKLTNNVTSSNIHKSHCSQIWLNYLNYVCESMAVWVYHMRGGVCINLWKCSNSLYYRGN